MACRSRRLPQQEPRGTAASPNHPSWFDAITVQPNCCCSTCIRTLSPPRRILQRRAASLGSTKRTLDASTSLNETGYLYVPANCENNSNSGAKCRLHVAFHGCEQYVDKIHGLFFRDAGYNGWAEAHHVIILYPQATPSSSRGS